MGHSAFVGRVGVLAVALGVGFAVATPAGPAWADPDTTSGASADSGSGSAPDAPDLQTTGGAEDGGDSAPPEAPDPPGATPSLPSSPSAHTTEVAPGVTVSSSGGALTSDSQSWAGSAFIQTIKDNSESDENAANMGLFTKDWTPKAAWFTLLELLEENARLAT